MKTELSEREMAVIDRAARGYTDDMIAADLGIGRGTVNSYWVRIRGKLGHLSRTELVARLVQRNADDLSVSVKLNSEAEHRKLLGEANAEIDRLQQLLDERSNLS